MPYVTCQSCGLRTYCVRADRCPRCDALLLADGRLAGPGQAVEHGIVAVLAIARRELEMDTVFISEIADGREVVRWAVGNQAFPTIRPGFSIPLQDTICRRLLDGEIDAAVGDIDAEPALRGVPGLSASRARSYLGVPVTLERAQLYVLCCLGRERRPDLGARELSALRGVAE